jgi:hypothetical protein
MPRHPTNWDRYAPSYSVAVAIFAAAFIALFAIALIGGLVVHILVIRNIYLDPTFSRTVSVLVILFVVLRDVDCLSEH